MYAVDSKSTTLGDDVAQCLLKAKEFLKDLAGKMAPVLERSSWSNVHFTDIFGAEQNMLIPRLEGWVLCATVL